MECVKEGVLCVVRWEGLCGEQARWRKGTFHKWQIALHER